MRTIVRGIIYALSLVVTNMVIGEILPYNTHFMMGLVFFALEGLYFLKSAKISEMLQCGFVALPMMFIIQINFCLWELYTDNFFVIYVGGLIGTIVALMITIIQIISGRYKRREKIRMDEREVFDKWLKIKMLLYALVTAVSFSYLVLAEGAGVSVLIFGILQAVLLLFIVPEKKRLFWCLPMIVLCLNSFISANEIWRVPNFIVCMALYALMFTPLNFKDVTLNFLAEVIERLFAPLAVAEKSIEWLGDMTKGKKGYAKRLVIALGISMVMVGLLCAVLSGADMVFSHSIGSLTDKLWDAFNLKTFFKLVVGCGVGIYLFGIVYNAYIDYAVEKREFKIKGDVFIISFVMASVLAVYTIFVVIQFKYLFSGNELPYGLNVTEYARRGFFELLGLTGANIAAILIVMKLTEHTNGKKAILMKFMNTYLCAVTVVLLASSFYRMQMYNETDGLTRLRFLVFGFLAFELVGLMCTFVYIIKPKFNIVMIYGGLALCYYLILNIIPMDALIAKNQVDRYLNGDRNEVVYVFTLSADAAKEVERIYQHCRDYETELEAKYWLIEHKERYTDEFTWHKYNLAYENIPLEED